MALPSSATSLSNIRVMPPFHSSFSFNCFHFHNWIIKFGNFNALINICKFLKLKIAMNSFDLILVNCNYRKLFKKALLISKILFGKLEWIYNQSHSSSMGYWLDWGPLWAMSSALGMSSVRVCYIILLILDFKILRIHLLLVVLGVYNLVEKKMIK